MQTFIMLTSLARGQAEAGTPPAAREREVMDKIEAECPRVAWKASYALLGPADYLDVFEAPDCDEAMKVALIVRSFGWASTETWPAVDWQEFKTIARAAA